MAQKKSGHPVFDAFVSKLGVFGVFDHFLENASLVLANFSYLDGLDHSLHFLLRPHARKKSPVTLILAILCPNCVFFCAVFKLRYFGKCFHVELRFPAILVSSFFALFAFFVLLYCSLAFLLSWSLGLLLSCPLSLMHS